MPSILPNKTKVIWSRDGILARIYYQEYRGLTVKTLVIELPGRTQALSTMDGFREISFACNNYAPPQLWKWLHEPGNRETYLRELLKELGLRLEDGACLSTGVDMDNVVVKTMEHSGLWVTSFATAGVKTNAMRAGLDEAQCVEEAGKFTCYNREGTINIILLTNAKLTAGAMARTLITITEAKVAALQDLDVRSSYNPKVQATGTGTDNAVIISGKGPLITYTGGHSKIGELMAKTVYEAVKEAIIKSSESPDF
jgi:adenosylcobinamide amidohydrolase